MVAWRTYVFATLLFVYAPGWAQQDSVRLLRVVEIQQSRLPDYQLSGTTVPLDSATLSLAASYTLADLLRKQGIGHLRSYGPGGLATPSFRGTGANHTVVLWNGINLSSPLSGQLDFSQVPMFFMDDASIQQGGVTSLYGGGSIGGTIQLNNSARFHDGLRIKLRNQVGSFSTWHRDAGISFSGKRWMSKTNAFRFTSDNDFSYTDRNRAIPRVAKREHSAIEQTGVMQQFYWQPASNHMLSLKGWYQDNFIEVPNSTFAGGKAEAIQTDKSFRTVLSWHYQKEELSVNYQAAHVYNTLYYEDPPNRTYSNSRFQVFTHSAEVNYKVGKFNLGGGGQYNLEKSNVDDFGTKSPQRDRIALFSALKYTPAEEAEMALSIRQERVNNLMVPLAASFSITSQLSTAMALHGSASRSYRLPSFNDLYWVGAGARGNPDLLTETSWTQDLGLTARLLQKINWRTTAFNNFVDEWIGWAQDELSGDWSPRNTKKVWSRGVESRLTAKTALDAAQLHLTLGYTFTKATNREIAAGGNEKELGKQLMLTPMHEGNASVRLSWKKYQADIVYSYTGKQFNSTDNSVYSIVKSYQLLNLWMSRSLVQKQMAADITLELNNVMNVSYQGRPGYPMPGRNFRLAITLTYHKPNKQ